jgi:lysozyme family protein
MCCESNLYEAGVNSTLLTVLIVSYSTSVYITVTGATKIPLLFVWVIFMEGTSSNFSEQLNANGLTLLRVQMAR